MKSSSLIDYSNLISRDAFFYFHLNKESKNIQYIADGINFPSSFLAIPEQVHSSNVKIIYKPGVYNNTDGLITTVPNILLCLQVADCVPIYLYAVRSRMIGLVHAGWRGIVNGIVQNTIEKMLFLGADLKEIKIYLGPSIGKWCYEVDDDVATYFNIKSKLKDGKWKVGIREQIIFFLLELGIIKKNIRKSSICTFESKKYHSYRRDGVKSGRLFGFAGIKK